MKAALIKIVICFSISPFSVSAEEKSTPFPYDILRTEDVDEFAEAELSDFAWLSGDWVFEADFSGLKMKGYASIGEAVHGQMLGYSRGWSSSGLIFNEILSYTQRGESVEFRLKHFSYDLHGWEPVDQPVIHPLLKLESGVLYFDTHTIVKENNDRYTLYLMTINKEGGADYHIIPHRRVK